MDFGSFVEGPLLKIGFGVFCIGVLIRTAFFLSSVIKNNPTIDGKGGYFFLTFARFFVPFHMAALKKPLYAALRYIFHICLFVVPIWLAGHISLWEESRFEWSWISLPDEWADLMTLICLGLAVIFILRRIIIKDSRNNSSFRDYIIIIIAVFPFVTGYFLAHGTLDGITFFADKMWTIHILSGEIWLVAAVFLFCRTRLNIRKCTGCASCVLSCPTGTLESEDTGNLRIFNYSHYQCICCASCVDTCPEDAAELRHEISLKRFFQAFAKKEIRTVELESCKRCGALFVPEPLMEKIQKTFTGEYLEFCPNCRKVNMGDYLQQLSPWYRTPKHHTV
jgi:formate hydrogenlyase subunit 6/NADH:ubiquinone oxidoreductase subunit I